MPARRRPQIASELRGRIERALMTGALAHGDRLPSTREMGAELDADPRVVLAAYRDLAGEGLVELRPRSGVYVARHALYDQGRRPPRPWLTEILAGAVTRGFSTRDFCDDLREAALGSKLKAAVIATTYDQSAGLCRELRADYGIEATGIPVETLKRGLPIPAALSRAHLVLTTAIHAELGGQLAKKLGKRFIVARVRPEIVGDEWLLLLDREVFVVAVDPRFLRALRGYLASTPGAENVKMLLAGQDDLSVIPRDAPTYVTQAARERLGRTRIPGRLIPPARVFSADCVRAILNIVVEVNTER